jgi:polar amino acid transport system permease protein
VGLFNTLFVSVLSISLATLFAILGAIAKLSGNGIAMGVGAFYTSYFRGVPLLMLLLLTYMGLPQIGYVINPVAAGVLALSTCYGAYMTEIFRAGISSIPKGQWEAADALGLARSRTFRTIILPQAMKIIVPPIGNQFTAMLKDSSLISTVGVWDLMFVARTQGRADFRLLEMLITASLIYWIMSIVLDLVQGRIERYFGRDTQSVGSIILMTLFPCKASIRNTSMPFATWQMPNRLFCPYQKAVRTLPPHFRFWMEYC